MSALEVARIPRCDPARFGRIEAGLLARGAPRTLLVLAGLAEPALVLGRHQRGRSALDLARARARGLAVVRRSGGGRTASVGDGVLGAFLFVPAGDPLLPRGAPAPRMMHRMVRGLLAGLRATGVRGAAWFGRDFVSADGRQIGLVSQEGTEHGAVALEALVAAGRTLSVPAELVRYPAHSDPRAGGPPPATLEDLRGSPIGFTELADAIAHGYAPAHDREVAMAEGVLPEAALPPVEEDEAGLASSGLAEVPIGFVEALAASEGGRIARPRLRGDLVAPAFVLSALEADLHGAPLDLAEAGRRVDAAFRRPHAFVHGIRELRVLAEAAVAAAAAA
jgi:lipoate-protein ligase A